VKTDAVFYQFFATSPETFFLLLGLPFDSAREMSTRYVYEALEFKETSHRTDGVFRPMEPGLPIYFLEMQLYQLPSVYADVLVKAYTYLKQHDPAQPYCAVVLFGSRALEPKGLMPYQPLLDAGHVRRLYLDEMPEVANAPLGLSILGLIGLPEEQAPAVARNLVIRTRSEIVDEALRSNLVQLIETVVIYKLHRLTREEIQAMLQVHDIRETRVYQEAKEEGREEGRMQGREEERQRSWEQNRQAILRMAARQISPTDIAEFLGLDVGLVRKTLGQN
jgi:predicted transposase/invertase (TIGR01784 family)